MLFIISGPSGAGKSTLIKIFLSENNNFSFSISYTTRDKKTGEVDGKDYYFISKEKFKQLISKNFFIEWANVYGNYYGTSYQQIQKYIHDKEKHLILDIDVQGAETIKSKLKGELFYTIFIKPPNLEILKQRLINRKRDKKDTINKRLKIAEEELKKSINYNYCIENNNLDLTYNIFKCIIKNITEGGQYVSS